MFWARKSLNITEFMVHIALRVFKNQLKSKAARIGTGSTDERFFIRHNPVSLYTVA
jgi:hypothetical protein